MLFYIVVSFFTLLVHKSSGQNSLNVLSLLSWQLEFVDEICHNRTGNSTVFEDLKETLTNCQKTMLNGTGLTELSYDSLESSNVEVLRGFYES